MDCLDNNKTPLSRGVFQLLWPKLGINYHLCLKASKAVIFTKNLML